MRKLTLYAGIALSLDTQTKPLVKGEGGMACETRLCHGEQLQTQMTSKCMAGQGRQGKAGQGRAGQAGTSNSVRHPVAFHQLLLSIFVGARLNELLAVSTCWNSMGEILYDSSLQIFRRRFGEGSVYAAAICHMGYGDLVYSERRACAFIRLLPGHHICNGQNRTQKEPSWVLSAVTFSTSAGILPRLQAHKEFKANSWALQAQDIRVYVHITH
ncbi:hypothetical protein AK812_SmicGene21361 [Symbiodinium microadriaticum]|uniref:Uncharacterized protein n=1 Tax=Symbiodinium microadriaticum TaxID=2951 RepID=A0A1Q9DMJ8_SYMMI|nr:hypothetical protein AK812_SmicGene21361 [Symbiodinium microadriaticum]